MAHEALLLIIAQFLVVYGGGFTDKHSHRGLWHSHHSLGNKKKCFQKIWLMSNIF
jgi:hypothetical protein